jgi:hypothetical protein
LGPSSIVRGLRRVRARARCFGTPRLLAVRRGGGRLQLVRPRRRRHGFGKVERFLHLRAARRGPDRLDPHAAIMRVHPFGRGRRGLAGFAVDHHQPPAAFDDGKTAGGRAINQYRIVP